jgi:hypothetical protein
MITTSDWTASALLSSPQSSLKHTFSGTLDQILYDPFPDEAGEGHPIDLRLCIALEKRLIR